MTTLDRSRIRAITLDLDDTLWPIWPTIARADQAMRDWLAERAPAAARLAAAPEQARAARDAALREHPELAHDLSRLRCEAIRWLLRQSGEDPSLAEPAFEVFFEWRQRVELFADALPALEFLSARFPLVAISNGNADLGRVGLAPFFQAAISAREFGVAKPDPRIFHAAAQAASVAAEQVLHVGDDARLDAVGALNAGMQVVWVNREAHAWTHAPLRPHAVVADLVALCALLGYSCIDS